MRLAKTWFSLVYTYKPCACSAASAWARDRVNIFLKHGVGAVLSLMGEMGLVT